MYRLKGTAFYALLEIAKKQGDPFLQEWLGKLGPDEYAIYENLMPVAWYTLSMDDEDNAISHMASLLFPGDPLGIRKVAKLQIKESISRIYQFFIRIPSTDFVLAKSMQIWKSFHDTGVFSHEKINNNQSVLMITNYEKMPSYVRQVIWGAIEGIGELIKKDFHVTLDESNPDCWKWTVNY